MNGTPNKNLSAGDLGADFAHFSENFLCQDDGFYSFTTSEQKRIESQVTEKVGVFLRNVSKLSEIGEGEPAEKFPVLYRDAHVAYLRKGLMNLEKGYECLDSSRPWLVYWIVHSLSLLNEPIPAQVETKVVQFLKSCWNKRTGGYGGGPGQDAHLATTYAAILALSTLGTQEAYDSIDRAGLYRFLFERRGSDGGFRMHLGGEADIRGVYCALVAASLTNIIDEKLVDKTAQWVVSCQTYEGGFGASHGFEAHGGYTFCGLAALVILGRERLADSGSLLRWLAFKQMPYEGGFQGRTNKLVDACYSFWQAASFPLAQQIVKKAKEGSDSPVETDWLFHSAALQHYVLICCQNPEGGLYDKPGKTRDFYHTCYALSGLSIAQRAADGASLNVVGSKSTNLLERTHPVYNIEVSKERKAREYFGQLPPLAN